MLLERLPGGHVVAVDESQSMVEHARDALPAERATVLARRPARARAAGAGRRASSRTRCSTGSRTTRACSSGCTPPCGRAAASWLSAGARATSRASTGPRGRWAAEAPYADFLADWTGPWNFAGAEETAERLERAGFVDVDTWLQPWPVTPDDPESYLRTVCLGPHLERLPEELRGSFVRP